MTADKRSAREAATAARRRAQARADPAPALAALDALLAERAGQVVAGYLPMRTEIDPRPAMALAAARGPVCVPVTHGRGRGLTFRAWRPDAPLVDGGFGTQVPAEGAALRPDVLIVPCLAFDAAGTRLGYGAGHYDRTLEALRAEGPCFAIGLAFAAQQVEGLPTEPTDQPLDLVVTERGTLYPGRPTHPARP